MQSTIHFWDFKFNAENSSQANATVNFQQGVFIKFSRKSLIILGLFLKILSLHSFLL
jgi:hypothetical protein